MPGTDARWWASSEPFARCPRSRPSSCTGNALVQRRSDWRFGTLQSPASAGGWILLGERPGQEIAFGLVGKFWRPVIEYAELDAPAFKGFSEPGYAKTVYALGVRPLAADRTPLAGAMRTATTDDRARRWFRRYWTLGVGTGAHILVNGLLDVVREDAQRRVH